MNRSIDCLNLKMTVFQKTSLLITNFMTQAKLSIHKTTDAAIIFQKTFPETAKHIHPTTNTIKQKIHAIHSANKSIVTL